MGLTMNQIFCECKLRSNPKIVRLLIYRTRLMKNIEWVLISYETANNCSNSFLKERIKLIGEKCMKKRDLSDLLEKWSMIKKKKKEKKKRK